MKYLLINTVCGEGSTGNITLNFHKYLKERGHSSIICYGRGPAFLNEEHIIKIDREIEVKIHAGLARLTGLQGFFSNSATKKLLDIINEYKPNVVYLFNLHGYYLNEFKLLSFLKEKAIPTIYWMMDEYPFLGKCCFSYNCIKYKLRCSKCSRKHDYPKSVFFDRSSLIFEKKEKLYKNWKSIAFVSVEYVIDKLMMSNLYKGQSVYKVDHGIDLHKTFTPKNSSELKKNLGIASDTKIVLNVGPFLDERKGLKYFLEAARLLINENIIFINVGFNGSESMLPKNFLPVSYIYSQNELAIYYSLADLSVCTSIADAMPTVCLQALACGTPICGFNISGMPYIAVKPMGVFVDPFNSKALANAILKAPRKNKTTVQMCREYAESRFSEFNTFQKIEELGREILHSSNWK